jgi:hypothetical protein
LTVHDHVFRGYVQFGHIPKYIPKSAISHNLTKKIANFWVCLRMGLHKRLKMGGMMVVVMMTMMMRRKGMWLDFWGAP